MAGIAEHTHLDGPLLNGGGARGRHPLGFPGEHRFHIGVIWGYIRVI